MPGPYPSALFWVDIEATGLPVGNDFSGIEILELGVIVTDFDLKPYFGYQGVVQMNDPIKEALKANPEVFKMHLESGLLKESKDSTDTLQAIEAEIIGMLKSKSSQNKGEFLIAGSGVAQYDQPLIREKMPELASWLNYAPFDIGVQRRTAYYLSNRRDLVPQVHASYTEGEKAHRALGDIKAHLKEAIEWKKFYEWAANEQTKEADTSA